MYAQIFRSCFFLLEDNPSKSLVSASRYIIVLCYCCICYISPSITFFIVHCIEPAIVIAMHCLTVSFICSARYCFKLVLTSHFILRLGIPFSCIIMKPNITIRPQASDIRLTVSIFLGVYDYSFKCSI